MLDKTKNYKIDVSELNTAERRALQEELFKMGYQWFDGGQEITDIDKDFLFLYDDMDIACCKDRNYFNKHSNTPVTVEDILPQPIQETITLRDYFAGCALIGILPSDDSLEILARDSYRYADAMIKERTHSTHKAPTSDSKPEMV